eukprot:EC123682.1.p1 GENE.EC123682.1~~EC123682.1.p1  ORF type:complete len:196 (+),score=31.17 EC123682.1:81-590(+)
MNFPVFGAALPSAPAPLIPFGNSKTSTGTRTPVYFAQAVKDAKTTVFKSETKEASGFWDWLEAKLAHNLFYEGPDSFVGRIQDGKNPTGDGSSSNGVKKSDAVVAVAKSTPVPVVAKATCGTCNGAGTVVSTVFVNSVLLQKDVPCATCSGSGKGLMAQASSILRVVRH